MNPMKLIKWTLRKNFLIPTLVVIIVGMGISTYVTYHRTKAMFNESAMDEMTQLSSMSGKIISFWIQDRKIEVTNWATEQIFEEALNESEQGRKAAYIASFQFDTFKKNASYYEVIALCDKKGDLIASTNKDALVGKINVTQYPVIKQVLTSKQTLISDTMLSKTSGTPYFAIAAPVFSLDKTETIGAVIGVITMEYLSSQFVAPIKIGRAGYAYIIDEKGMVIAHPEKKQLMQSQMGRADHVREMLSKKKGDIRYTFEGEQVIAVYDQIKDPGWIMVARVSVGELFAPALHIRGINLDHLDYSHPDLPAAVFSDGKDKPPFKQDNKRPFRRLPPGGAGGRSGLRIKPLPCPGLKRAGILDRGNICFN